MSNPFFFFFIFFFGGGGILRGVGVWVGVGGQTSDFKIKLHLKIIGCSSLLKSISPFCALASGGSVSIMGPSV